MKSDILAHFYLLKYETNINKSKKSSLFQCIDDIAQVVPKLNQSKTSKTNNNIKMRVNLLHI